MQKLTIILRTCEKSILEQKQSETRICGNDRKLLLTKSIKSLSSSIRNTKNAEIKLKIIDDSSSDEFIDYIKLLLENIDYSIIRLKGGFSISAYESFKSCSECESLVYSVEDDYLHTPDAIHSMLEAYNVLSEMTKNPVVLYPDNCIMRYSGNPELCRLFYDGKRFWRTVCHTAFTFFTDNSVVKNNFEIYQKLALGYPNVFEDDTINTLYINESKQNGRYWCFNPIPSVAWHISYSASCDIKAEFIDWKMLWDSL